MFIITFIIDGIVAFWQLNILKHYQNSRSRGTNKVTRFIRDTGANAGYTRSIFVCMITTVVCLILSFLGKPPVIPALPTVGVIVYAWKLKSDSTKDEQRVKDARGVTKGSLQVTGAVASDVGTAVGYAAAKASHVIPGKVGAELGNKIGDFAGSIATSAADSMTDVEGVSVKKTNFINPELFIERAKALGMAEDGEDLTVVANRILSYASPTQLEALPDKLSLEDKAMQLLQGGV